MTVLLYDSAVSGNCYKVRLFFALLGVEYERRPLSVVDKSDREEVLGGLEGGHAVSFSSGMAACSAVLGQLPTGAHLVIPDDCYQGVAGIAEAGARDHGWQVDRVASVSLVPIGPVGPSLDILHRHRSTSRICVVVGATG